MIDITHIRLMINSMIDKIYTVEEVAKILKCSERTVWRYIKSKKLKVLKLSPKILRFTERDIESFLKHK